MHGHVYKCRLLQGENLHLKVHAVVFFATKAQPCSLLQVSGQMKKQETMPSFSCVPHPFVVSAEET